MVITLATDRIFCSGANIYMLATPRTRHKVTSASSPTRRAWPSKTPARIPGQSYLAACNGTAAGGGYELALACDEIYLVDDGSAVTLPEVPLLGVLPGTGGLTRLVDKRKVRRDRADFFCTRPRASGQAGGGMAAGGRGDSAQPLRRGDAATRRGGSPEPRPPDGRRGHHPLSAGARRVHADTHQLPPTSRRARPRGRAARLPCMPRRASPDDACRPSGPGRRVLAARLARELDDAHAASPLQRPEMGTWLLRTRGRCHPPPAV